MMTRLITIARIERKTIARRKKEDGTSRSPLVESANEINRDALGGIIFRIETGIIDSDGAITVVMAEISQANAKYRGNGSLKFNFLQIPFTGLIAPRKKRRRDSSVSRVLEHSSVGFTGERSRLEETMIDGKRDAEGAGRDDH